jgi:hypothetical protein
MTRVAWFVVGIVALAVCGAVTGLIMRSALCAGPWLCK